MAAMYFKSADPAKQAAWVAHAVAKADLRKKCQDFAQQFVAPGQSVEAFISTSGHFHGACFTPRMPLDAWTVPCGDADTHSQRAALKGRGFTKEQKEAHAALRAKWDEGRPLESVRKEDLFKAIMGVEHDFFHGMTMFVHEGVAYVRSVQFPAPDAGMQEILGSEYNAAEDANNKARHAERMAAAQKGGAA